MPSPPDTSKCRWCRGVIAEGSTAAFIVSFLSKRGMGFLSFAFCSPHCLGAWAKVESKAK